MLRIMRGVSQKDRIRNDCISGSGYWGQEEGTSITMVFPRDKVSWGELHQGYPGFESRIHWAGVDRSWPESN